MFAGSAIAQNAGRLANIHEWSRTEKARKWLLIRGASNPPKSVASLRRRTVGSLDATFLPGNREDLTNLERALETSLYNIISDLYMKKKDAVRHIDKFLKFCSDEKYKPMLYYTGHGELGTGNWCFLDGTIGIEEIKQLVPRGCLYPTICSDACHSGAWAHYCIRTKIEGFECLSACREDQTTVDNSGTGGELTRYMTGREVELPDGRPNTEPLFSGGAEIDYPSERDYLIVDYADFIEHHTPKRAKTLIWQSVHGKGMLAVFDEDKRFESRKKKYFSCSDFDELSQKMAPFYDKGFDIFSLSCDQHTGKFYVYMVKNYGRTKQRQIIQRAESQADDFSFETDYSITSCTASSNHYFFVLTRGVESFDGLEQKVITKDCKKELNTTIQEQRDNDMILTSICYNVKKRQYLIVTTASRKKQQHAWFKADQNRQRIAWTDNLLRTENLVYTIWFEDPSDGELLVVMTLDNYRSGYKCKFATINDR